MKRTTDYDQALVWASELGAIGRVPKVWIPKVGFSYAVQNNDGSVSFTRGGNSNFGLGIGPNPVIDETWQNFALPKALPKEFTLQFELINRWNPYQIKTSKITENFGVEKISEVGIAKFLDENAPNSSVYPGSSETLFWAGIKQDRELVAVGCVGEWESGNYVISSIATKESERNKGFGSQITKGIVYWSGHDGIDEVTLAINAKNEVAARVYEKIGFTKLGEFNTFERQV
jgi:RimJ/RimL family protein N-acetyltransferase